MKVSLFILLLFNTANAQFQFSFVCFFFATMKFSPLVMNLRCFSSQFNYNLQPHWHSHLKSLISHSSDLEFFQEKFSCMARLVYSETLKEIDLCRNKWIIFINWHLIVQRIWKNLSYICFLYSVLYLLKVCIYFSIYLLFSSKITIV